MHVLKLTPELWTLSLPHRTQILYAADISLICLRLGLRPGDIVVESGTGSGSLTHALARSVGPTGKVFTFEFSEDRVNKARVEFASHGLTDRVICTHRDAVASGFQPECALGTASAVFLDLPNPWGALQFAKNSLMPNGILCSFSPCIEQVQRVCEALPSLGFEEIRTFESLSRVIDVTLSNTEALQAPIDIYRVFNEHLDRHGINNGEVNDEVEGSMDNDIEMNNIDGDDRIQTVDEIRGLGASVVSLTNGNGISLIDTSIRNTNQASNDLRIDSSTDTALTFKPAAWTRSIVQSSHQLVSPAPQGRGHTGYLTFATLYSSKKL